MKRLFLSFIFPLIMTSSAYANCQWGYVNELNKDIKQASEFLSDYSTCRNNCKGLESNLNNSIAKMGKASVCGGHILTVANRDMINFISSRFRLIQKQKTGSTWTKSATTKPTITKVATPAVTVAKPNPILEMEKTAFVEPQVFKYTEAQSDATPAVKPEVTPVKVAVPVARAPQTRMRISSEAYAELWPERVRRTAAPPRNVQRAAHQQQQLNYQAKQKQLIQQRLVQQRKQAQIQHAKQQLVLAKKRAMQNHVNRQLVLRQQFLKKRALMQHMNRLKVRRLRLARAQRNRSR